MQPLNLQGQNLFGGQAGSGGPPVEESQNSKNKIKYVGKKQCLINCSLGDLPPLSSE